jgi:hypothetical protein
MSNDYFSASSFTFTPGTTARATTVTSALEGIEAAFEKLPDEAEVKLETVTYGTAGGTANAYTVTLPHTQIAYTDGMRVVFKPGATNTGASTVNVDSIGVKSITRTDGTALVAGDIVADYFTELRYNSTSDNFEIVGMIAVDAGSGTMAAQNATAVSITGGTVGGGVVVSLVQGNLQIGGVNVNLTAAELNQFDGLTVGGNSSGDLLTTDDAQTLSNKTFTDSDVLRIISTETSNDVDVLRVESPNLTLAGTTRISFGATFTEYNMGTLTFRSLIADSSTNFVSLGVYGHDNLLYITGAGNVAGDCILDEDTMSSDDAGKLATQQSIKAYVDNEKADILDGTDPITVLDVNGNGDVSGTFDIGAGTTRRVAPAGTFVNEANDQPVAVTGEFDIDSNVTETAWESIGPTGSGADNTWTALNSVPADADWIQVRIACEASDSSSTASALRTTRIYARGGDGSQGVSAINQIHKHGYYNDSSGNGVYMGQNTVKIPVDSNIVFDVNWTSSCESLDADLYLIGWGFNP